MRRVLGLSLCVFVGVALAAQTAQYYTGLMRLPLDLYTADGVRIEKGEHRLEIKPEAGGYVLLFPEAEARVAQLSEPVSNGTVPLVGAHYLRSSLEPVLTAEERHFSKTGRPQYEEEERDWKLVLRVYQAPDADVIFLFQERGKDRRWSRVNFRLLSQPPTR